MSIAAWIDRWAMTDRLAFRFEGQSVSYAEFAQRVLAVAAAIADRGIGRGDRVGYCGLNRIEFFEVLFAAARIGAVFVPFNNRLTPNEVGVQLADCTPAALYATDGFHALLADAGASEVQDLDTDPITAVGQPVPDDHDGVDDTVLMVYTSGTTGIPKGALLSHNALLHTVLNGVDQQQLTADDRTIAPLPTFHVGGLNIQTLPTLFVGGEVLLQRRFDPAGVLDLVRTHRATHTLLVPAMLSAVAAQPDFATTDLSSLRGINSGSSVVPFDVMAPFFDRGVPVGQVYGMTESGPTAVVLDFAEAADHIGSCGRPATHTELRIVDPAGNDVAVGEAGELLLRGANMFSGYWNNPEATAEAFTADGWFRTGDVGHRDDDGYVVISDRITDVVISGGENIYPAEIEPILATHDMISEVAVIGAPSEQWGEIPVAVVVLAGQADASLDIEQLREWCDGRMARFKQPRELRIADQLPRTALGKVKKHELR